MKFFSKDGLLEKSILISFVYYAISGLGLALTVKADIGVSSWNALILSISTLSSVKVGTITSIANISFLVLCFILDKDRTILKYLIMFLAQIGFGYVVNFFLYGILSSITLPTYVSQLAVFILGTVVSAYAVGRILYYKILQFPIENFCNLLAQRSKHSMKFYRYGFDIVSLIGSLVLTISFGLPIYIREGTIIALFLFSYIMAWSYEKKGIDKK